VSPVEQLGFVAVMQDITELKRLDQMKSEFVATVSHDLGSPLTTIQGYADMLHEGLDGENREFAKRIKSTAAEMARLVADLLDLGKIEAGVEVARVPCQMDEVVLKAVDAVRLPLEEKGLTLTVDMPSQVSPVLGDAGRLRQVLDNLLSNAVKYTLAGGWISIRLREGEGSIAVEVQDSGIGIPREALPQLFSKFYRVPTPTPAKMPGTGLGLTIVKSIVELHGGRVWAESEIGEGSTFGFSLPTYTDRG
jgi:signal transduction histidine kinase